MKSSRATTIALALVSLGVALVAYAQQAPPGAAQQQVGGKSSPQSGRTVSARDRQFVYKAAQAGIAEVDAGELAQRKALNAQVKEFATRMVQDHAQTNDRLKQVASGKGIDLPARLDKSGEKELDKLRKLSGAQFDRAYIKAELSNHGGLIKEFQKEVKSLGDPDIRAFAEDTLPILQEHLKLAQSAEQSLGPSSSSKSSPPSDSGLKAAKDATGAGGTKKMRQTGMPLPTVGM